MRGKGRRRVARQPMAVVKQPTQTPATAGEEEQFQDVVLGLIARYSRYSWITWLVVKIILKVTTYTVLKADKMDAEAHTWITDWGPFVNPVISLVSNQLKMFQKLVCFLPFTQHALSGSETPVQPVLSTEGAVRGVCGGPGLQDVPTISLLWNLHP